ncbi:MAG: hypothetical protein FWH20_06560 [Oscillospiraceae bacterium]|nr:hypothetical protein [Oscillospiraceae bacterium]
MQGRYTVVVEGGNRMIFPADFRKNFDERVIVAVSMNNRCLRVYSEEDFDNISVKLLEDGKTKAEALKIVRFLSANAYKIKIDKTGRLNFKDEAFELLEYANIEETAVFVGVGKIVEIWNKAASEKVNSLSNIEKLAPLVVDTDL